MPFVCVVIIAETHILDKTPERERERERNDAKHLDRPFDGERVAMAVKPAPSFGRGE
jgi:hypothetical protein